MNQDRNRNRSDDEPNRPADMEQAEGSRESFDQTESMRNRQEDDLGTSSDRAMFEDRESAEERESLRGSMPGDRGAGPSAERGRSNAGGITNRPLDRERNEQEQLPDRGRSQSDSER